MSQPMEGTDKPELISSDNVAREEPLNIVTAEQLQQKIMTGLNGVHRVVAVDTSDGCGAKFEIEVVCEEFTGKPLLAQHRMVHKAIEEERKKIHALTLKTSIP